MRFGWHLWWKSVPQHDGRVQFRDADEESVAVSSASNLVRKENEALKQQLQQLAERAAEPPLPPPQGAPPLPFVQPAAAEQPTPLRQAMEDLAGKASVGPMFSAGEAAVQKGQPKGGKGRGDKEKKGHAKAAAAPPGTGRTQG